MEFVGTSVEGAVVVRPERREDQRGWFARIYCVEEFASQGLDTAISQINLAETAYAGTVRGLHYQLPPGQEAKLIRCMNGAIFDVVVDVRPSSPTFGQWAGIELTADDGDAFFVPAGCAHGYQALTTDARALYHASEPYAPELERGIHHADPKIGIDWPLAPVHVSDKDQQLPALVDAELPRT